MCRRLSSLSYSQSLPRRRCLDGLPLAGIGSVFAGEVDATAWILASDRVRFSRITKPPGPVAKDQTFLDIRHAPLRDTAQERSSKYSFSDHAEPGVRANRAEMGETFWLSATALSGKMCRHVQIVQTLPLDRFGGGQVGCNGTDRPVGLQFMEARLPADRHGFTDNEGHLPPLCRTEKYK
jgi:hypothetical protein